MTDKGRELLLEVLLLAERYSARDVAWVSKQMSRFPHAAELVDALRLALGRGAPEKRASAKKGGNDDRDPRSLIGPFIAQFNRSRSTRDLNRFDGVAKRLGIDPNSAAQDQILREVERRLNSMSQNDLSRFLRNYKIVSGPDSNYVGLAEFLIGHDKQ